MLIHTLEVKILCRTASRINATHQSQTFDRMLVIRVVVIVSDRCLVAIVEIIDMDITSIKCTFACRIVINQQVIHLVACRTCLLVEGIIILSCTLMHLLHKQFCPRHQYLIEGAIVLFAELCNYCKTLRLRDVGRHHIIP